MQIKTASTQTFLLLLWPLENVMWQKTDFSQSLEKINMPTQSCKFFLFLLIQRGFFSAYNTVLHKSYAWTVKSFPTQFKRAYFLCASYSKSHRWVFIIECVVGWRWITSSSKRTFKIYKDFFLFSSVTWCILKMFYQSSEIPSGNILILKLFLLRTGKKVWI